MVCLSTGYSLLCDKLHDKRVLVTSYSWSIGGQTQRWRHHRLCFVFLYHIKQIDSMFPWVCTEKDHRRLQNVVRTSVTATWLRLVSTSPLPPYFDVICEQTHGNMESSCGQLTRKARRILFVWVYTDIYEYTGVSLSTQGYQWVCMSTLRCPWLSSGLREHTRVPG